MKNFPTRKRAMNYYFRKSPTTNPRIAHVPSMNTSGGVHVGILTKIQGFVNFGIEPL